MSPTMIFVELQKLFPEFTITKYGRVNESTIWFERKGSNDRLVFSFQSHNNYILKKESRK